LNKATPLSGKRKEQYAADEMWDVQLRELTKISMMDISKHINIECIF